MMMPETRSDDAGFDRDQRGALVTLIEIQPDLSEIVDDRRQRGKFFKWAQRATRALVEFLKWGAMVGAAIGILKASLHGWLNK